MVITTLVKFRETETEKDELNPMPPEEYAHFSKAFLDNMNLPTQYEFAFIATVKLKFTSVVFALGYTAPVTVTFFAIS